MKFKNTNDAILLFEENAEKHGVTTLNGDYKEANKCYKKIQLAKNFLLTQNDLNSLECLLHKESISIKIWAARYLLFSNEYSVASQQELIKIHTNNTGILASSAKQVLEEWQLGNLTLEY